MCCAQTAAPEEKKRKRWEIQKRSECTITSIISKCNEKRRKIQPWDLRKPSRTLPEPSKIDPEFLLGSIWQPGGTQERPRDAQEEFKRHPRAPKRHPRAPKSRPRGIWEVPEPLQNRFWNAPGPNFRTLVAEIRVEGAAGPIFTCFVCRARGGHFAPMCVSYHSCQCFVRVGASTPRQRRRMPTHPKTCENKVSEPPKPSRDPPETLEIRARSAPRRTKTGQER